MNGRTIAISDAGASWRGRTDVRIKAPKGTASGPDPHSDFGESRRRVIYRIPESPHERDALEMKAWEARWPPSPTTT
jgi:hypothetical protein